MFQVGDRVTLCLRGKKAEDMLGIVTKTYPATEGYPHDEVRVEWLRTPFKNVSAGIFPIQELTSA